MKKIIMRGIILTVVLFMIPAIAKAEGTDVSKGTYHYEKDEVTKTCTLVGFTSDTAVETIIIPASYEGYTVTKVAAGIFADIQGIKEVILMGNAEFVQEEGKGFFADPANITFYYQAGCSAGQVFQNTGGKLVPLSQVTGVKAKKNVNLKSAVVSWSAYPGAYKYYVYIKTAKGLKEAGSTTATNIGVNKLASGTKVEFVVSAEILTEVSKTPLLTASSNPASVTLKPAKVKKFKAKALRGKIRLSWSKVKNISGYHIQRKVHIKLKGFKPKFSHLKTVKGSKKKALTNVMLVRGMKYSYRIRTYKMVGKKKIYSEWVTINKKRCR